jgi:hypothetical protein
VSFTDPSPAEAERQLAAAMARHREVVASLEQEGRSATGDATAAGAVARGMALVAYALGRAHAAGVAVERLADVSGWEPDVVRMALEEGPTPVLARALPDEVDPGAVSRAAATVDQMARIDRLLGLISADVIDPAWSPAAADLDDLCDRLERQWRGWRRARGRAD